MGEFIIYLFRQMSEKWKLSKEQKDEILRRLAARDSYQEIANAMECSWANIDYYAKKFSEDIKKLREEHDARHINRGLRTREKRLEKLEALATRLEYEMSEEAGKNRDTDNGGLWAKDIRVGRAGKYDVEVFVAPIVQQYRGLLDDIAKEQGHRVVKTENKNEDTVFVSGVVGFSPDEWTKLKQDQDSDGDAGTPN
jgi:hypothetical protein